MDDTDLARRLDRCFGDGPDSQPPVDLLVGRGRRTARRRRAAGAGLAAAAVAAVAVASLAVTGGQDRSAGRDRFVSSPSAPPAPTAVPSVGPTGSPAPTAGPSSYADRRRQLRLMDRLVTFGRAGHPRLAPGATVADRIDDPYDATAPAWSIGLAVSYRGQEYWYAESGPGDGSYGGTTAVADPSVTFEQFVADADPGNHVVTSFVGPDVWPDVVAVDGARMPGGTVRLTAAPGFTILAQQGPVDVGPAWAGPGDETAAALVRREDGEEYYVLARRFDGKPAQYVVVPRAGNGADLAGFVDLARQRYADAP